MTFHRLIMLNNYCRNFFKRLRLTNKDFTIISQNCIGGMVSHDLGVQFKSPTVDLYMNAPDFLCFLENLRQYTSMNLEFFNSSFPYPTAKLGELTLHFVH